MLVAKLTAELQQVALPGDACTPRTRVRFLDERTALTANRTPFEPPAK